MPQISPTNWIILILILTTLLLINKTNFPMIKYLKTSMKPMKLNKKSIKW